MRKSKFLALLLGIACVFGCIAALNLSASADALFKKVAKDNLPTTIGNKNWASFPTESSYDDATNMYYYRCVPNDDTTIPRLENSNLHVYLPTDDEIANGADYAYMKIIMRTNVGNVTPRIAVYQYYAENGGASTTGGEYNAESAVTGNGTWQTVYLKINKTGYEFKQYHFRPMGTLTGSAISGGVEGKYVDIAAYAFFKTETEARAYDLIAECQGDISTSNAVFLSASGNDANDGLSVGTAVATIERAQAVAAEYMNVDTIYIVGSFATPSSGAQNIGIASKPIQYLGYPDASNPPVLTLNHRLTLAGDLTFDNMTINSVRTNDSTFQTRQYSLTLGSNLTHDPAVNAKTAQASVSPVVFGTVNGSFTDPAIITIESSIPYTRLAPSYSQSTWNGYVRFNLGSSTSFSLSVYGGNGSNPGDVNVNGIVEINAASGSSIGMLTTNKEANVDGNTISKGLRNFHLDGSISNVYLAGSQNKAAVADSTGVTVWNFSNTSSVSNFKQNGVANETAVTHVLIFNDNDALHTKYENASASWTVPNEYCFNVDATGIVEAYMSKLPTSTSDLTCTLGGIKFSSNYTHAIIDEGTANEQTVELATLTDGQYAIENIAEGDHTVTFADVSATDPVTFDDTATKTAAGYTAASVDAAEKAYAIIASFKLDTFDSSEITSFGAYFFDAESNRVDIYSSNPTLLDTSDGQYYVMIYGIDSPDTSVAIKPYVLIGENAYYGTVLEAVPATIGCDTYYGTESDVVNYFS